MAISPFVLIIIVFAGVFIFIAGASYYLGSGTQFENTLGKIVPTLGSIFSIPFSNPASSTLPPTTTMTTSTTTSQSNQTKCTLSGGHCIPFSPVSPLECRLEFLDETLCGKGFKCCIPR